MILTTPSKKSFKNRFNRRDYTCGCSEKGKKVNRNRRQDRLQQYQATTKRKKFIVPSGQATYYTINHWFPEIKFPEIPKYKKGVDPVLQFITIAASANHEAVILTPISRLLLKFTFNPEISSNRSKTVRIERTFSQLFSPTIRVSSAN